VKLDDQALRQIDKAYIERLLNKDTEALANLALTLVNDLKDARELINQNPNHSSQPPGSCAPGEKSTSTHRELSCEDLAGAEDDVANLDHVVSEDSAGNINPSDQVIAADGTLNDGKKIKKHRKKTRSATRFPRLWSYLEAAYYTHRAPPL